MRVSAVAFLALVWACGLHGSHLHAQADEVLLAEQVVVWMDRYADLPTDDPTADLPRFTPGYLEKVEARTQTDRFRLDRQRYALRAMPKLWYVRRAEHALQESQRAGLAGYGVEAREDARAEALAALFDLAGVRERLDLLDSLRQLQVRLVEASARRLVEPDYEVERALDAQDELGELELDRAQLADILADAAPPVPLTRVASLAAIRTRLVALAAEGPATLTTTAKRAELEAEIRLERAENLQLVDFLQASYRGDEDLFGERLSLQLSLQVPRLRRNIRALDELAVEGAELDYRAALAAAERRRHFAEDVAALRRDLAAYDRLAAELAVRAARRERLLDTYTRSQLTRPDAILRLQRRALRERLDLLEAAAALREDYADLLGDYVVLDAAGVRRWVVE